MIFKRSYPLSSTNSRLSCERCCGWQCYFSFDFWVTGIFRSLYFTKHRQSYFKCCQHLQHTTITSLYRRLNTSLRRFPK